MLFQMIESKYHVELQKCNLFDLWLPQYDKYWQYYYLRQWNGGDYEICCSVRVCVCVCLSVCLSVYTNWRKYERLLVVLFLSICKVFLKIFFALVWMTEMASATDSQVTWPLKMCCNYFLLGRLWKYALSELAPPLSSIFGRIKELKEDE